MSDDDVPGEIEALFFLGIVIVGMIFIVFGGHNQYDDYHD